MKIIILGALLLSGCTTLTPRRCADIDVAASTVQEITAILMAQGIEVERARKLATAVKLGNEAIQRACAQANSVNP